MNICSFKIIFLPQKYVMEKLINASETRQFKAIFPNTLNANETLFGGQAMQWMDEVAYITATRFTRQRMFTVNTENIRFLKAVQVNSIVEVVGRVEKAESVKLYVKVEIYAEEMYGKARIKVIEGVFVFAALDENKRPVRINYNQNKNLTFNFLSE
jgi:acyl-CoA hydrolase